MSLSAVLGRGEPGHLPGEGWEFLPVKIGHVAVTCLCDLLSMGSHHEKTWDFLLHRCVICSQDDGSRPGGKAHTGNPGMGRHVRA